MVIGLGQLRLSPQVFWEMVPLEFLCAQKGFFDYEQYKERQAWMRTISMINIHLPKGMKIDPNIALKEKKKPRIMTREEFEQLDKKWSTYVTRKP